MTNKIEVVGLRELQRELRRVDQSWPKELRVAAKEAADLVTAGTRASFASRPGSASKVAPTVKTLAQQRGASVKIGAGSSVGSFVALGNEFGGGKYGPGRPTARGGHTTQFPKFRKAGYSLYPTFAAKSDEVVEAYGRAVDRIAASAFPS